ncbi:MAG: nitrile hydratase accessory protein [Lautropia sp.]|nr:nitrile hydratase accessory protein [Lautropia sp.]
MPGSPILSPHEPAFNEPWEAQAFSLAVGLSERGVFTWPEWADVLAGVIADPGSSQLPYYEQWLLALEKLLISRNLVSAQELAARREAWRAAARATPHGQPIVLPPP